MMHPLTGPLTVAIMALLPLAIGLWYLRFKRRQLCWEILDYLASANDPVANQALQSFMVGLEAVAASTDISDDRRADIHLCLDATSEALADSDDPRAWAALVAHAEGYSSAAARCLTALGRRDLSRAPGLVNRLMEPAVEEMGQSRSIVVQ